jgi:hypothetical protein
MYERTNERTTVNNVSLCYQEQEEYQIIQEEQQQQQVAGNCPDIQETPR